MGPTRRSIRHTVLLGLTPPPFKSPLLTLYFQNIAFDALNTPTLFNRNYVNFLGKKGDHNQDLPFSANTFYIPP